MGFLIIFVGTGLGGASRHATNLAVTKLFPGLTFPLATLPINVLGSFLMGILAESFALRGEPGDQSLRLLLTTGVLGGFTTFRHSRSMRSRFTSATRSQPPRSMF